MWIIPAIDLLDGKCVRLLQGRYENKTIYYENPLDAASKFIDLGVKILHIVDLNGAYGKGDNINIIKKIIKMTTAEIQVGGGIRSIEKAERLYSLGVERVICGTAAIKNPDFVPDLVNRIGSKHLMVALDHRNGKVLVHGWQNDTDIDVFDLAKKMEKKGAGFILFSSADVDGTLLGPDVVNTLKMVDSINIPVIAAGGISSHKDIENIRTTGVFGIVIGKAIYEGKINLKEELNL
ncbi:MAG: 1-(5-phosphoribosyl)-5-[(5-phosphoribosylamino)methylideneamino]imidazole-4-carboxamide isomerase [Candidatus Helarchaeota archaeon]